MAEDDLGLRVRINLDNSGFQSGMSALSRQLRLSQTEFQAASAKLGDFGTETERLGLRSEMLNRNIEVQRQKVELLQRSYQQSIETKGADARATEELAIRLNKAQATLSNFENDLTRTTQAIEDQGRATDRAGDHMQEAGKKTSFFGDALKNGLKASLFAVTAALATVSGAVISASSDLQSAMGRIESGTGVTGDKLETLAGIAREVFKSGFGDSIASVSDSITILRQNLGSMYEDEMGNVLQGALTIEERFGAGVDETSKVVKTLTANFKELSKEQALDLITVGFQQGGNFAGDLLDTLNEYAPQFASIGMSAQQMMGMLISGSQAGAFNLDKVGDSLKEFNIRAQDGSKATSEGFAAIGMKADDMAQKISSGGAEAQKAFMATVAAISSMKDPVQQNITGVNLFGTQWEDVRKTVITAMQDGGQALGNFEGATQRAADAMHNNLGFKLKEIWRQVTVSIAQDNPFSAALNNAADSIMAHLPQIQAAVGALIEGLHTAFVVIGDVLSWVKDNADTLIPVLTGVAGWIAAAFAAEKIMAAVTAIRAAGGAFAMLKGAMGGMLFNPWVLAIGALVAGAVLIYRHWDQIKAALSATWNWIKDTAASIFNGIKEFFVKWGSTIAVVLGGPIAWIGALIYQNWDSIKQKTEEIWGAITSFFAGVWDGIVGVFSGIWSRISPPLTALWDALTVSFTTAWEIIKALVVGGWQNLVTVFTAAKDTVVAYVSGMWEMVKVIFAAAFLIVYDLVTGKWGEIGTVFSSAGAKIRSIIGNVWDSIKGIWSGAFAEVQARTQAVWNSISALWNNGMNYLSNAAIAAWGGIKAIWQSAVSSVVSFVVDLYNQVTNWFSNLWATTKQSVRDGWEAVYSFFANAPARAASYVQELKDNIAAKWEQLKSDAASAGSDFINGFVQGIKDKIAYVRQTVENAFGDVVGWAKKVLDIHSPSRVMQEIGQWTMEGFVVGIEDKESRAYQVVQAIGEGVQKALSGINLDMDITNTEYQIAMSSKGVGEIDRLKLQLENLNIAVDTSTDRLANLKKAHNDTVYVLGDNAEASRKLYLEILKEQKVQQDLQQQVDKTNSSIEEQTQKMHQEDLLSRLTVLQTKLTMTTATMAEKIKNLNQQHETQAEVVRAAQQEYERLVRTKGEYAAETADAIKRYADESKKLKDISTELDSMNQKYSDMQKRIVDVADKFQKDMAASREEYDKKVSDANNKLVESERQVTAEYEKALDARTNALLNFAGLFDEVKQKDVSGDQLLKNLKGQVDAFDDWKKNLNGIKGRGIDSALFDELEAMGPKAGAELKALNGMTDEQLKEYVNMWRTKNQQARTQATNELTGMKADTKKKIDELRLQTRQQLDQYRLDWQAKNAQIRADTVASFTQIKQDASQFGTDFGSAITRAIDKTMPMIQSRLDTIRQAVAAAFSEISSLGGAGQAASDALKNTPRPGMPDMQRLAAPVAALSIMENQSPPTRAASSGAAAPNVTLQLNMHGDVYGMDDLESKMVSVIQDKALPIIERQLRQPARASMA